MNTQRRQRLIMEARERFKLAESDYEAIDLYRRYIFNYIRLSEEKYRLNMRSDRALYHELLELRDEIFIEQIQKYSSMNVLGAAV